MCAQEHTMSLIGNSKKFYINSRDRVSGNDGDFTAMVQLPSSNKFDRVALLQCLIPKSYYLINLKNRTFQIDESLTFGGTIRTITLDLGNYTRRSFQTQLTNKLNIGVPNTFVYQVNYPNISTEAETGKYIYTVTGNDIQPSIITTDRLFEPLGFDPSSTNTFIADEIQSKNVIKLQLEDTLFIHSDICSNETDNVLQEILGSRNDPSFSNVTFSNFSVEAYSKLLTSNTNNVYRFHLTDEDGFNIDLNGLNMEFTIVLYQKNPIWDMLTDFMKFIVMKLDEMTQMNLFSNEERPDNTAIDPNGLEINEDGN